MPNRRLRMTEGRWLLLAALLLLLPLLILALASRGSSSDRDDGRDDVRGLAVNPVGVVHGRVVSTSDIRSSICHHQQT